MKYSGNLNLIVEDDLYEDFGKYVYVGSIKELNKSRRVIFKCKECLKDPELFGDALFIAHKSSVDLGDTFCGCSNYYKNFNEQQCIIKVKRACVDRDYKFEGIVGEFKNARTRCNLRCNICNHSWTSEMSKIWHCFRGCPGCARIKLTKIQKEAYQKPDEYYINIYRKSLLFHPDTIFTKSDKLSKKGNYDYFNVICGECNAEVVAIKYQLTRGQMGCLCAGHKQKQVYIMSISDIDGIIALKYGISRDSYDREKEHNRNTNLTVELLDIFYFDSVKECKACEFKIRSSVENGFLDRSIISAGFSETVSPINLDKIIKICLESGGIR